jgi:hypothetical protein
MAMTLSDSGFAYSDFAEFHVRAVRMLLGLLRSPHKFAYIRLPVGAVSGISTCAETWPSG